MNVSFAKMFFAIPFVIILQCVEFCQADDAKITKYEIDELQVLVADAIDWAHEVALLMRTSNNKESSDTAVFVPFSLFPTPYPRKDFQEAMDVQTALQELQYRISLDIPFLDEVHAQSMKDDLVTRKCMEILHEVHDEGVRQPLTVFLQRSDYLLHKVKEEPGSEPQYQIKQVELNTGVVGGSDWAEEMTRLHRRMAAKAGIDNSFETVPENKANITLAEGLVKAWEEFGDPKAVMIIMVYKPRSQLQFTSRHLQYEIEKLSGGRIKMVRLGMAEAAERLKLADDFSLRLGDEKVSVVYCGVLATKRWTDAEWAIRRDIERSTAIKSPTLAVRMSGSKKIQQVLALPGVVERFFPDTKDAPTVAAIRKTYAGLWGLEGNDEKTLTRIEDAIAHPENYVMKPEGGGGGGWNYFGEDIAKNLKTFTPEQRASHILMERLHSPTVKSFMVWPHNAPRFGDKVVSELSIFGCLMGNQHNGKVLYNVQQGHLMRTKFEHVDEGGISVGGGVLDSPYLY